MSQVSSFLANLGATLLTDESAPLLPLITDYTNSLAADSSFLNLQAQNIKFAVAVQALGPQEGSIAIKDTAVALQAFVQTQLPALIKSAAADIQAAGNPTPAAAPAAAAVVS